MRIASILSLLFLTTSAAAQNRTGDGTFTLALTGDAIITRRMSVFQEVEFTRLIELVRNADAAFTNLEMLFHDYEPWPMNASGGTWMRAEPALLNELVWAGFDLVAMANNHTGDYGVEGLRLTQQYVDKAGLVRSGTGENLWEAREAKFLETADGRVALIAVASTFTDHSVAGKPRGAVRGRPGLNPLRHTSTRIVSRENLERMRALLREMGSNVPAQGDRINVFGTPLMAGDTPHVHTTPNEEDVREIAAVVRGAANLADYVIVSIHAHESAGTTSVPAEFIVSFAHSIIDAGADVFVGHGPHVLRGIELYKGKPIFYSLGDFLFQNETLLRLPDENYRSYDLGDTAQVADFNDARYRNDTRGFPANREVWESVVAVPEWKGDQLANLTLYPITLGFGKPRSQRGRPMLADAQLGRKIIDDLIQRSKPFGTTIEWSSGTGIVRLR